MTTAGPALSIDHLTVRFGGLTALDDVSLHSAAGAVTGLIGPNGAGKTTLFNACTGLVSPSRGAIHLGDRKLSHLSAAGRARLGLGRTFQRMELFDNMTVRENVSLGPECCLSGRRPWGQLFSSPREKREINERAVTSLERCGITDLARRIVGDLSTGQRRIVELARAIASPFTFLLLDEPSSGLDVSETERFGHIVVDFVADTGTGVLLVEHDMGLVSAICNYIYVLDFGCLIFSGSTADTLASETVRAAYLGGESLGTDEPDPPGGHDLDETWATTRA